MNEINKYGLLNALLNIINHYEEDSPKLVIAKYLLQNFNHIDQINIYDAAEECAVSRASIRRFSQEIGFHNFKNLKEDKLVYDFYTSQGIENYALTMEKEMQTMIRSCNYHLEDSKKAIAQEMVSADEIMFLVSDIYSSRCLEFQKELILNNKMVRIISHNFDENKLLDRIKQNTLVIVISTSGRFMAEVHSLMDELSGKKIIFTATEKESLTDVFDYVIPVGNGSIPSSKSVYHTFAIEYCLDVLINEYKLLQA